MEILLLVEGLLLFIRMYYLWFLFNQVIKSCFSHGSSLRNSLDACENGFVSS